MSGLEREAARERILEAAETLFTAKGFDSVTLRDISSSIGLTHAALYYHFAGGKEELFAEVMERNIRRHGAGLAASMREGGPSLRGILRGASRWLLSQPPMDLIRMAQSDLKALPTEAARRISMLIFELIILRLQRAFEEAMESGEIGACDPGLLGGGILGLVESLHSVPEDMVGKDRFTMGIELIDIILKGIDYKEGAA